MKSLVLYCLIFAFFLNTLQAQIKSPGLNHIALSVLDLKRSTDFYTNVVHLDTIPEPFHDGRHTWLSIGDASALHLIQNPVPIVVPSKNTHICFSTNSLEEFVKTLDQNKIPFEDWLGRIHSVTLRPDGVKQIYFKDPDGYWIEINDAKE